MLKIIYSTLKEDFDKQHLTKIAKKPPLLNSNFFNNNIKYSNLSIYARLLCFYCLEQYHSIQNIRIGYTPHQKPFIDNYQGLYFNFTHSKNAVMLVIANFDAGIDLQYINYNIKEPLKLAGKILSESEIARLSSLSDKKTVTENFLQIWTEKEAFAKCEGTGLSIYKDFRFDSSKQNPVIYKNNSYYIREIKLNKEFKASVCCKNRIEIPNILQLEQRAVLDFYT